VPRLSERDQKDRRLLVERPILRREPPVHLHVNIPTVVRVPPVRGVVLLGKGDEPLLDKFDGGDPIRPE
jgi:hypothetical protein